ncbi:TA system antitoxin ParD family protein [Candidatus Endoriftia persephonae]|jgi:hypothetical protein|uniref:ParD-like antitoxin of type II toxin-antitoxin system n=2 Tax=Gammaproteobacteria TaxID=1236 RepID=G2FDE1_9GAMM|nr:hypothetical protein [Candidatus Endoriftia persephone]EGW55227.1 hypothetical protein TevJSym_ae00840 [endosymbiont of Tevnia jerichonana (vent Tica)]USF88685.1 ParD-like family protein [Candidatus Endoriftia persephone]
MATSVKFFDNRVSEARRYGAVYCRSIPKQFEYWSRISKIAEENPDLPCAFIREILIAREEATEGERSEYQFGEIV